MASHLLWIGLTIAIWLVCAAVAKRMPLFILRNPLILAIILLCVLLTILDVEAQFYLNAISPLTFFIGLTTVSLAVPLWQQRALIRDNAYAMLVATLIATLSGIGAAWLTGTVLGLSATELASIAPRMTTLAVALPLSTSTGGLESLTILGVMCNGIGGVLIAEPLWRLLGRKTHPEDRAFTLGTTSHAMGIAWSINIAPKTVAFASCGMLLSALMTTALYGVFILFSL